MCLRNKPHPPNLHTILATCITNYTESVTQLSQTLLRLLCCCSCYCNCWLIYKWQLSFTCIGKIVEMEAAKKRRILFIVPTIVLVQQTYKTIKKVQPTWNVRRKSGSHNIHSDLSVMLQYYQVLLQDIRTNLDQINTTNGETIVISFEWSLCFCSNHFQFVLK